MVVKDLLIMTVTIVTDSRRCSESEQHISNNNSVKFCSEI